MHSRRPTSRHLTIIGIATLLLSASQLSCHLQAVNHSPPPPTAFHYQARFADDLKAVTVTLCFSGPPPQLLVPGEPGAMHHLQFARLAGVTATAALPITRSGIDLSRLNQGQCLSYGVSLNSPRWQRPPNTSPKYPSYLGRTGRFLWRPPRSMWNKNMHGTLAIQTPSGLITSAPFERTTTGNYALDYSAFAFSSRMAIGRLQSINVRRADCVIQTTALPGLEPTQLNALVNHLEAATQVAATVLGHLPVTRLQILIAPSGPGHGRPVLFGQATRGGSPAITLLVSSDARPEDITSDWTAVHELSHLFLPFVRRSDAWLSEGVATYYQEVLRARAGLITTERALERLLGGISQVARSPTLARQSRDMYRTGNFPSVYWGGAAFAFLTDLTLRTLSTNPTSLDATLSRLQLTRNASSDPVDADTLLSDLDSASNTHAFSNFARRHISTGHLPTMSSTLSRLAITFDGQKVRLTGPSRIRDQIFSPTAVQ